MTEVGWTRGVKTTTTEEKVQREQENGGGIGERESDLVCPSGRLDEEERDDGDRGAGAAGTREWRRDRRSAERGTRRADNRPFSGVPHRAGWISVSLLESLRTRWAHPAQGSRLPMKHSTTPELEDTTPNHTMLSSLSSSRPLTHSPAHSLSLSLSPAALRKRPYLRALSRTAQSLPMSTAQRT